MCVFRVLFDNTNYVTLVEYELWHNLFDHNYKTI